MSRLSGRAMDKCDCGLKGLIHDSSCAVHNAPALPVGDCNCSLEKWQRILRVIIRERRSTMPKKKGGRRY